jgi:predicted dehydrogenase
MSQKKYQVAVIGGGRATEEITFHAFKEGKKYAALERATITYVVEPQDERREFLKKKFNIPQVFSSAQDLFKNANPDFVIINSPVKFHYEHALLAIEHRIPFIVEKPAMETLEQLKEVEKRANERGIKGSVVHNYNYKQGPLKAKAYYDRGDLGEILSAVRVWMSPPQNDRMEMNQDGWWHKLPGGRLADSLPHHLYTLYPYVGKMKIGSVSIQKNAPERTWSKCDEANIVLETKRGHVDIILSTNQESWPHGKGSGVYDFILFGTKQSIAVFQEGAEIFRYKPNKEIFLQGLKSLKEVIQNRIKSLLGIKTRIGIRGGHNVFYAEFIKYLEDQRDNPTPWDEAIHVMELVEEISLKMEEEVLKLGGEEKNYPSEVRPAASPN